ncbi:MFS transporter [Butyrivibrio sp. WCD3002]|uniref:MFS transporter n=1 Tax=Butyrivibrio sp. WCD3002 TaxID=1280676 RepID=UPI00040B01B3|nr:MFS transporter [Butyrivibrio sp. WCD3002]
MSKKALGLDKFGVRKVMRKGDYFADSLGQFALNSIAGLVGQLTYFYTDKVGMAAGAVATVFFITKIIDAFTDIIMGNIVDHTAPGKEKYRPWILRMAIPAALVIIALFTVPSYDGMAEVLTPAVRQAIYAFSIYIPLTLFVIMFILTAMFDLEAKLPELREQTRMRKEAKN